MSIAAARRLRGGHGHSLGGNHPAPAPDPPSTFQPNRLGATAGLAGSPRKTTLTDLLIADRRPRASDLRHQITPIELLRNTTRSRQARAAPAAPDTQFEFLPRRGAGAGPTGA